MPNRLRTFREAKNISQAELARAVGVTRQALSAIETHKQEPSLPIALKIARVLDTGVEQMFFEDTDMQKLSTKSLSKAERLVLVNQYKTLQAVNAADEHMVKHYHRLEEIFERGYVQLYGTAFSDLWDELPPEVSEEALSILDMHRAMLWSLGQSPNPKDVERVKFIGFDGNNESDHLGFAEFFTQDGDKYKELHIFDSHHVTLPRYRRMLEEWKRMERNPHLTREQIDRILEAGTKKH
jgi:uncharacterized protein